jgi:hypothetical protein
LIPLLAGFAMLHGDGTITIKESMNDVFISYAHLDNQTLAEGQTGWVERFHRSLSILLGEKLGKNPAIWRDKKLAGNDFFDETIMNHLGQAKALISIVSPRYVQSEWCLRELEEFCRSAEQCGGLRVQDKCRFFKVVKTKVEERGLPAQIGGLMKSLIGYEFFEVDAQSGRIKEYQEVFGKEFQERFFNRVNDLAFDVCEFLKIFETRAAQPERAPIGCQGKTVYLAVAARDLQEAREQIRRELLERGYKVLPDAPFPECAQEIETAVRGFLERSDLSVHLAGERYGMIPDGSESSIVEMQNALAAEHARVNSKWRRIIWIPEQARPATGRQEQFLRRLQEDAGAQHGAEVLRGALEDLKAAILEALEPMERTMPGPAPAAGGAPWIYVIGDQKDDRAMEPLADFLFEQGLEVRTPEFEGTEADVIRAHRHNLQVCDAALIYYGAASPMWVDTKLSELKQAPGYGRVKPFLAKAVCIAPPDESRKKRFRTHEADLIQFSQAFSPEALQPFLNQLSGKFSGN